MSANDGRKNHVIDLGAGMSEKRLNPVLEFLESFFGELLGEALSDPEFACAAWLILLGVLLAVCICGMLIAPQLGGIATSSDLLSINPEKWPKG